MKPALQGNQPPGIFWAGREILNPARKPGITFLSPEFTELNEIVQIVAYFSNV